MESAIRGLVLDSSVLVAAERAKLTTPEVLRNIRASADVGDARCSFHVRYTPDAPKRLTEAPGQSWRPRVPARIIWSKRSQVNL